jgi:glycosyltransferase involved in cell wall biosynthesis
MLTNHHRERFLVEKFGNQEIRLINVMKICLISSLYGISGGGAGLVVQQLARGLRVAGHQVVVITSKGMKQPGVELHEGIKIYTFRPANLFEIQEKNSQPKLGKIIWQLVDIYNPWVSPVLEKIIHAERPDVVHVHKMRSFSGAVWRVATELAPGRVVQTCHDYESMSPVGTLEGRLGQWAKEGLWPVRPYQLIRANLSRNVSVVTSPSLNTMDIITRSGLFPDARREWIPNSNGFSNTQLVALRLRASPCRNPGLHLLYLGRLEPEKGLRELCAAFSGVSKHNPSIKLTIAGWGSLEKELLETYGNAPGIIFTGQVVDDAKSNLLSNADLLVVPSTYLEISPLVVLEAYAFGKPVLASRIGGLPELIEDGKTGWLVEPVNVAELAQAIESAIHNPALLSQMSLACFQKAEKYSVEMMTSNYEKLYLNLLNFS